MWLESAYARSNKVVQVLPCHLSGRPSKSIDGERTGIQGSGMGLFQPPPTESVATIRSYRQCLCLPGVTWASLVFTPVREIVTLGCPQGADGTVAGVSTAGLLMKLGVGDAVRIGALPLGSSSRAAPAPHGGWLDTAVLDLACA